MESNLLDSLLSIPPIQDGIFQDDAISKRDLARYVQVSKSWYKIVIPFLWRELTEDHMEWVDPQSLTTNAKWIRQLGINQWEMVDDLVETGNCINLLGFQINFSNEDWHPGLGGQKPKTTSVLEKLIHQNSGLKEFWCSESSYGQVPEIFTIPVAQALIDSCSNHLESLKLCNVALRGLIFGKVLNSCRNLKVLWIEACSGGNDFLDHFDDDLSNLEELVFRNNNFPTSFLPDVQGLRYPDWTSLLKATKNGSSFRTLRVGSNRILTPGELTSLVSNKTNNSNSMAYGPSPSSSLLANVSNLSLMKCLGSDNDLAKVLAAVQPLESLYLSDIHFGQKSFRVVESRHQNTLQEWSLWGAEGNHPPYGLIDKLKLPSLTMLICEMSQVSFKILVPQLYGDDLEEESQALTANGQEEQEEQQNMVDDDHESLSSTMQVKGSLVGNQSLEQNHPLWRCPELRHFGIYFSFSPTIEMEILGGSWNETFKSPEELYVQAILILLKQVSGLKKIQSVDIMMTSVVALNENSVHWKNLDGCWLQMNNHDLYRFRLGWSVPDWLQRKHVLWHRSKFP